MRYLLLLLNLFWFNTAQSLTVTASTDFIQVGQKVTFTANDAKGEVNWSALKGNIVGKGIEGIYIAPNKVGRDTVTVGDDNEAAVTVPIVIHPQAAQSVSLAPENGVWKFFSNRDSKNSMLLSDDQRILWVGTNGGLEQRNAHTGQLLKVYSKQLKGLPHSTITSLLKDTQGGLWVGTYEGGLAHMNAAGQWQVFNKDNSGLPGNYINSLYSDGQGGLWVGTYGGGLAHMNAAGQWQVFNKSNSGLPDDNITSLLKDAQDGLWIGTDEGLAHLNAAGQWQVFNKSNSDLPDNYITSLVSDAQSGLWVGTIGGLAHMNAAGQWQVFNNMNSSLQDNWITSLLNDTQKGLWVGTYKEGLGLLIPQVKDTLCLQQTLSDAQCSALLSGKRAAILIAGGGKHYDNNLWYTTSRISNDIYKTLSKRGFSKDEIFYVTPETDADFDGDGYNDHIADAPKADEVVTTDSIKQSLDWATQRGKLDQPLYFFFIDHGGSDKFLLSKDATLNVSELNSLFNDYQQKTGNEIVIVLDACFSGELGKKLEAEHRAVITSAGNSYAFFNTETYQGFSRFLAKFLNKGLSFTEAFGLADKEQQKLLGKLNLNTSVTGASGQSSTTYTQTPYMANANKLYPLDKLFLNGNFVTGDATLSVSNTTKDSSSAANQPLTLTAKASVAQGKVERVWAVIRPPRMDFIVDQYNTPILAFPRIELIQVPGKDNEWQTTWGDSRYNGEYSIAFYAKDSSGDVVSSDTSTHITVKNGIDPPEYATTRIELNQDRYKAGDQLIVKLTEELSWGYDLYVGLILPQGDFITFDDKNHYTNLNQASRWRSMRQQGQPLEALNLTLPALPSGQYCFYIVQSPEHANVLEPSSRTYWKTAQQCFEAQGN